MNTAISTRDLSKRAPHSPRDRIAGFAIAMRAVDKCRASMVGSLGEYHYDCPVDNLLFDFKGITGKQFKDVVQSSRTYEEIGTWLQSQGTAKTPEEIKTWSDKMETASPMSNPERRASFMSNCSKLGLNPATSSTFDWLEADDRASFSPQPAPLSR